MTPVGEAVNIVGRNAEKIVNGLVADGVEVAAALRLEIAGLAGAATHPGLVETAMSMAKLLDDPAWVQQHPAAARSLDGLLVRLHAASRGTGTGKLALMRSSRSSF